MNHACGNGDGVHWLELTRHSRTSSFPSLSYTWLAMQSNCGATPAPPTPSPTPVVGDCSCYGRAAGVYTIAGVPNVYCQDNAALLQYNNNAVWLIGCAEYGFTDRVSLQQCGYMASSSVRRLAAYGTSVRLVDGSRGQVESTTAVRALVDGTSWHVGGVTWSGSPWDFSLRSCSPQFATGWPNMYHACGNGNGVHWFASVGHSSVSSAPTSSATWLTMKSCTA